ncbi:MAG: nicotinate (nicotinamide) nucleotide adenylyltransferase [Neisseriaceae bacterium]|nr:nicotinate (nicotinamide) nucleotide adenylyltransferase [Neisseriaceae bacterium]
MNKIGLFGGTFDPPHRAHLSMALAFIEQIGLSELILIPAGTPYHKQNPTKTSPQHRLAMCELLAQTDTRIAVSDIDIQRQGNTYTYDTVRIFRECTNAQLWWLLGSDSLCQLHTWYRYEQLLRLVNFAVVMRDDDNIESLPEKTRNILIKGMAASDNNENVGQIKLLSIPPDSISSTYIRQQLNQQSFRQTESLSQYVLPSVAQYILQNNLYLS